MNEKKRLIKNTGIIAIGNLSTKLVSFFLLPLYTALLSTSEYGTFDYILSIATFCVPFVSVLMDESIFRFLIDCKTENQKKKVISTSVLVVIIGMFCFSIIGIPIMQILHYKYTYYAIIYILLNVVSGMLSALLRGIGRTDQFAVFNFLLGSSQILLNVFFIAVLRWGLIGMLLASIIAQLIVSVIFILKIHLWKYISFKSIDNILTKKMIQYSFPLIPNKVSWTIINLSDRIILMNVVGSGATGLYAVSYKFPNLMDTVYGFFYQSWKESSARVLGDESQNEFYNLVYRYLKNFMFALVVGMIAFMPLVFHVLINESYYKAIYYVPILLIATYFANISGFYGGIFTAYKDTKIMGTTTVAAAIINLAVNILLIKWIGIYAAALSTLVSNYAVYIYRKKKVKQYISLKEDWKNSIISMVTMILILVMFYTEQTLYITIACILAVVYAIFMNQEIIKIIFKKIISNSIFLYKSKDTIGEIRWKKYIKVNQNVVDAEHANTFGLNLQYR